MFSSSELWFKKNLITASKIWEKEKVPLDAMCRALEGGRRRSGSEGTAAEVRAGADGRLGLDAECGAEGEEERAGLRRVGWPEQDPSGGCRTAAPRTERKRWREDEGSQDLLCPWWPWLWRPVGVIVKPIVGSPGLGVREPRAETRI